MQRSRKRLTCSYNEFDDNSFERWAWDFGDKCSRENVGVLSRTLRTLELKY